MAPPAIRRARRDEWDAALGTLVPHQSADERAARVREVLDSVTCGEMSLDGLLVAVGGGAIVGAGLSILMPDRVAFVWPPAADEPELRRALLDALSTDVQARGAVYAQALLDAGDPADRGLLAACDYHKVADLETLERSLAERLPSRPTPLWRIVEFRDDRADRFARLLEATYVGTLDCAGFTGRRSGREALESHRLAGVFDPTRWLLLEVDGIDAGALLQTLHPELSAWEIVYTGVVPECRRRGLGRAAVIEALHRAREAGCRTTFLAVDAANFAARGLYAQLGFVATARKEAWVRWLGASNRQ